MTGCLSAGRVLMSASGLADDPADSGIIECRNDIYPAGKRNNRYI